MPKQSGFIAIFLVWVLTVNGQVNLNYSEVDKTSWELFQEGKWHELIHYATLARDENIDFFYLQARTGIAYYNLMKYRQASEWFLKTWENDQPEWLQEYLYFSLFFGGRQLEAEKYASGFSPAVKGKIGFTDRKLDRVAIEAGYSFNPDFEALKSAPHGATVGVGMDYGEAFYLKNYHFESLDIKHRLSPGFNLNHNFTYIGMNREELVDWVEKYRFPFRLNQFQYFISPEFVVGKKLYVSPSATFIWGNYDLYMGWISGSGRSFYTVSEKYSDLVFSTSVWTHMGFMSPGTELNYADIGDKRFSQVSAWLTFYPTSNLNFYFTPRVYFKKTGDNVPEYNAAGISGGFQMGPLHFYGQYLNGEMENFVESGGYIVSNFPGISKQKFSGSLIFPTGKNVQFTVRYIAHEMSEDYRVYANHVQINSLEYSYYKQTLTVGVSWNF